MQPRFRAASNPVFVDPVPFVLASRAVKERERLASETNLTQIIWTV